MKSKRTGPTPSDLIYRAKAKELRRGDYDPDLFRMRASDLPYELIAKRLGVCRSDIVARARVVYRQFPEPKDQFQQEPFHA